MLLFLPFLPPKLAAASTQILSAGDRATYTTAFELMDAGQHDRGLAEARRGGDPLATKIAHWLDLTRRDTARDFAEIDAFLQSNPGWPRRFQLLRNAELSLPESWGPQKVLDWFGTRPPITGAGALAYTSALSQLGRQDELRGALGQLWISIDFEPEDEAAFHARFHKLLTDETQRQRLTRLLWDRRSSAARRQLQRVDSGHAALARARMALYGNKSGVDAAIRRVPASLRNDEGLLYERAAWRKRRSRFDGVLELLNQAPITGDHLASWWSLRKWVVWRALDRRDWTTAYQISSRHGMARGLGFAEGEWLAGWIAQAYLKQPEVALKHFQSLYAGVTSPISKSRGAFWSGEALSRLGRSSEAREWHTRAATYSKTFYGQLAAQRTGQEVRIDLAEPPMISQEAEALFLGKEVVRAAKLLGEIDQPKLQQIFLSRLRREAEDEQDHLLLNRLATALGRHELAIRIAKTARREGLEPGKLLYPRRPLPGSQGPEPALVLALIRQESEFYPKARSSVGALGLMQLMPATARQTARGSGLPYDRSRLTSDPEYNIRLGQAYLRELLAEFDGSYILALAAYNAGPSRARRWIQLYGDPRDPAVDPILWIERIPFSETRNYVQRILESLVVYRGSSAAANAAWTLRVDPLGS